MLQHNTFYNSISFKNGERLKNRRNLFYRYLFLFVFLFCGFLLKAQFDDEKYDKESFLIGTLHEYNNYLRTFTNDGIGSYYQRVDRFLGQNELQNALFIDSLFNSDYSDITMRRLGLNPTQGGVDMYSPALSLKIDEYYNYEPTDRNTGDHPVTFKSDVIYMGLLKKEQFETEKQKLSLLLGVFLSYGNDRDRTNSVIPLLKRENLLEENKEYENVSYGLPMVFAPAKANTCVELLKDLGCEVEHVVRSTTIPANGGFVIFIPSDKVQIVIDEAERLKKYIETIDTDHVDFTPDGTKFIWIDPVLPFFSRQSP